MRSRIRSILFPAAALLALGASGCRGKATGTEPGSGTAAAPPIQAELAEKLAAADALDGTTDHVVTLCAGCRLGMNGKAEHSIVTEGYTLHMCSAYCQAAFSKDLPASLAALEIPQS